MLLYNVAHDINTLDHNYANDSDMKEVDGCCL